MYDSTYNSASGSADAVAGAAVFVVVLLVALVFYVVQSIFLGMVFKKAGIAAWKAWVPIYNSWIMLEMGGQKGWWALVALIPFVNIVAVVFLYIAMYQIGLNFGKDGIFVILAILLPLVWEIWLAVDKTAQWNPTKTELKGSSETPTYPAVSS